MEQFLAFAVATARRAGDFLRTHFGEQHHIEYKGEINLVTEADRRSEAVIIAAIRECFPNHAILAEESPALAGSSSCRWIVDPLDGTTNYAHGFPMFCVSLALEVEGTVTVGVVYQPLLDEMFTAAKGQGAFLNGRPIHVSTTAALSHSLLATGFPYDIRVGGDNNMGHFFHMAMRAQALRRAGSAALDLAYVAAGRFDGFWELRLAPWDMAAGTLLVEEAGGTVTDLRGGPFFLSSPAVVASNSMIHTAMLKVLALSWWQNGSRLRLRARRAPASHLARGGRQTTFRRIGC